MTEKKPLATLREMTAGGLACVVACVVTNPMDVVKLRMQMQRVLADEAHLARPALTYPGGFRATAAKIFAEEGVRGLVLPGMTASVLREASYSSIRFGLYAPVKRLFYSSTHHGDQAVHDVGLATKFAAGMTTGALGSCLASPLDLVKIRQQAEAGRVAGGLYVTGLRAGTAPSYRGVAHAFATIVQRDGAAGLYTGVSATATRAALLTAGQMASYDHTKYLLRDVYRVADDGPVLHVVASVVAGLCAATLAAPADLVKSRIMGDPHHLHYSGVLDCFVKTVRDEGPRALFKGWAPSYWRLAPHFTISLPLFEQFRALLGIEML
ncbi:hypothetical protein H9P43_006353 [Blastocladiella emersonii ATCC 22665]|nr:hypothetical protein H9P43_006353 [Blastocladiella emersonii ATCC 22665]